MDSASFRKELKRRLKSAGRKVLLRIAVAPQMENPREFTGDDILELATKLAADHATGEGSVVLILLPHSPELFLLHLGLIFKGCVPAILPWPTSRMDGGKYQRNLLHQLQNLPAGLLITTPRLAENLQPGLPYPALGCSIQNAEAHDQRFAAHCALPESPAPSIARPPHPGADCIFLQFSGGTTGSQKSVAVSASILVSQLERLRGVLAFSSDDAVASWLPMYHDMGLIACLWLPLWCGASSTQFAAADWLMSPQLLFRFMDRFHATFTWLPNFAFSYLAQRHEAMPGDYALGHVRGFINCSEPVRLNSIQQFAGAFAHWGVEPSMLQTSYAMAENVFAVTQSPMGAELSTVRGSEIQGARLSLPDLAFNLLDDVFVSSGFPLPETELRVVDPAQEPCPEGTAGEIHVRSSSQFEGYWGSEGYNAAAIGADGFYHTGDYGFLSAGELYVIGRMKDIIIVGGQNIFPEDVETVVNSLAGIYPGRVVAFGVLDEQYGTETLAVVAEMRGNFEAQRAEPMQRELRQLVLATIGIAPRYASILPERWIVKSTAGKISRKETREKFLQEVIGKRKSEE